MRKNSLVAIAAILCGASIWGFGLFTSLQQSPTNEVSQSSSNFPPEGKSASSELLLTALMGPDGEYAAYAMYSAVINKFGEVEPYVSILQAESRHIQALTRQLERNGVAVPENPYVDTVEAPEDLQSSAKSWADGEQKNIELYEALKARTTDETLLRVFSNLERASKEVHLPLFELAAKNGGVLESTQMKSAY